MNVKWRNKTALRTDEHVHGLFENDKGSWKGGNQDTKGRHNEYGILSKFTSCVDICVISAIVAVIFL
jgi:hypothetical protein